jgi:hypothetical protein
VIPLRPLGVGELLDGAFTTIRRYPAATLGLAAAVMLVVEVIQLVASYYLLRGVTDTTISTDGTLNSGASDLLARAGTIELILIVVTLLATSLLTGILAAIVGQGVLGRPMSAGAAWAATRSVFGRLLGVTMLTFLIECGIVIVGVLPGIAIALAGAHTAGVALALVGAIGGGVAGIYVQISLTFATPVVMLEKQGIRAALSRSRSLVHGSWWRVFGIWLLATIIAQVIAGVIGAPFAILGGLGSIFSGHAQDQFQFTPLLLSGIGGLLGATLVRPFSAGVVALLYLDRRMRVEALDLTLQQAAARNPS